MELKESVQEILIVVDMQNDFINGVLGTPEAQQILPKVEEVVKNFKGKVLFTRDTHDEDYLQTPEGKNLPVPHCKQGSSGWEIAQSLQQYVTVPPLDKGTFGSLDIIPLIQSQVDNSPNTQLRLSFVGLCTDICVISNAMIAKTAFPLAELVVIGDCCAGVTPESHKNALSAMAMCQIKVL